MPSPLQGQFIWYDLMTSDTASAMEFYGQVFGWTGRDAGMPDKQYTVLSTGETMLGGVVELDAAAKQAGARPGWVGYIGTDDVDAKAAAIAAVGGAIHRPAEDIPGIGRFAVVGDPQGAAFLLFRPLASGAPPPPGTTPGRVVWHELATTDRDAALAFYTDQFGWTRADAVEMGPMGVYQMFATAAVPVGGIMNRMDPSQRPAWLFYVFVEGVDAALARVKAAGGTVLHGPNAVPGDSWVAQCLDPQGIAFGINGPR